MITASKNSCKINDAVIPFHFFPTVLEGEISAANTFRLRVNSLLKKESELFFFNRSSSRFLQFDV